MQEGVGSIPIFSIHLADNARGRGFDPHLLHPSCRQCKRAWVRSPSSPSILQTMQEVVGSIPIFSIPSCRQCKRSWVRSPSSPSILQTMQEVVGSIEPVLVDVPHGDFPAESAVRTAVAL